MFLSPSVPANHFLFISVCANHLPVPICPYQTLPISAFPSRSMFVFVAIVIESNHVSFCVSPALFLFASLSVSVCFCFLHYGCRHGRDHGHVHFRHSLTWPILSLPGPYIFRSSSISVFSMVFVFPSPSWYLFFFSFQYFFSVLMPCLSFSCFLV
jgi:hypothetical protein